MRCKAIRGFAAGCLVVACVALAAMAQPTVAQPIFETDEFQINVDKTGPQSVPSAAYHRSGSFVAVWESELRGVVARFFNRNRTPASADLILQANDEIGPLPYRGPLTVHEQPVIAMGQGQSFLLFWVEEEQSISIDIFFESRFAVDRVLYGQRFNFSGQTLGPRFRVGQSDEGFEARPEVAVDGDGNVTVVWARSIDGENSLYGRRFTGNGNPLSPEFRIDKVGDSGAESASNATVASLEDGTLLVVWEACCDGGDEFGELGIFGRLFGSLGIALSDPFQINTTVEGNQRVPVAVGENGLFLVAWQGPTGEFQEDGEIFRIYGRRVALDDEGPSGDEVILSDGPQRAHSSPKMAVGTEGDVILVWMGWIENFRVGVFGTRLSFGGEVLEPHTDPFKISQSSIGGQFRLGLTATPLGRFFTVWESFGDDGKLGIAARLVLPASEALCTSESDGLSSKTAGSGNNLCP